MSYTVKATGIRKAFGARTVLDGVDLTVPQGGIVALLGPNGAGKTTLIRILATLLRPDAGSATVAGRDLLADPAGVRRAISLTGQYAAVDDMLTGEENLRMMARLRHLPRRAARDRAAQLLAAFDLAEARRRLVKTYSGGMRRRLDLAASLVTPPELLFLDEPTTGLDPRSRDQLWSAVRDLARQGVTVLLTTQYLAEADELADSIAVLHRGSIVAEGTAGQLKSALGAATLDEVFLALTAAPDDPGAGALASVNDLAARHAAARDSAKSDSASSTARHAPEVTR
ncbi:MAG TPA: ATP-binding cassette domain-containing protein [Trebonia sp.]|nr:ATP-binding cassette domain-containing protein [Trebonia sp.]